MTDALLPDDIVQLARRVVEENAAAGRKVAAAPPAIAHHTQPRQTGIRHLDPVHGRPRHIQQIGQQRTHQTAVSDQQDMTASMGINRIVECRAGTRTQVG